MIPTPFVILAGLLPNHAPLAGPPAPTIEMPLPTVAAPSAPSAYSPGAFNASNYVPVADEEGWDFSYTFIEIGATKTDLDNIDDDADTYYGLASLDLFDLVYILLGYENSSTDFDNTDTDIWTLGAGVHFDVAKTLDVLADIAFVFADLSSDTLSDDSNGFQVRAGARWMPIEFDRGGLELAGRGIWVDLGDSHFTDDDQLGFDVEARLHFLSHFSVGVGYEMLEDWDGGAINARFSF